MQKIKNIAGKRFGRLVVLALTSKRQYGACVWRCCCDCGKEVLANGVNLRSGNTKSCGCLNQDQRRSPKPIFRKRPYEWLYNVFIRSSKESKRDASKNVSYEEFLEFTKIKECHYCGAPIAWYPFTKRESGNYFLDRKNNSLGYPKDNLVVCCADCNIGKGSRFTFEEWTVMAAALREYRRVQCS